MATSLLARNPLRRLSVALKLRGPGALSEPIQTTPDGPSISKFLADVKRSFLHDVKEDAANAANHWTVVMGNEAGGLSLLLLLLLCLQDGA
jgi:exopolyphosphatase